MLMPALPCVILGAVVLAAPALAQPVISEIGAGNIIPTAISRNHSVVAGSAFTSSFSAIRWTASGGLETLSPQPGFTYDIMAHGMSADGSVIVGSRRTLIAPDRVDAVYWVGDGDMQFLPMQGATAGYAGAASQNGSIIVGGIGPSATEPHAVRWVGGSVQSLGTLEGYSISRALAVSASGLIVYGYCGAPPTLDAFRWTPSDGMRLIPMPAGTRLSGIGGTNTAGSLVVGDARSLASGRAVGFIWTPGAGSRAIASPDGLNFFARSTNDAGTFICGSTLVGAEHRAAIWTRDGGVVLLSSYLADLGVDTAEWTFNIAAVTSADAASIAGTGVHRGAPASFLISGLPTRCTADFDGNSTVNSQDFFDFLSAFFIDAPAADVNGDASINSQDLFDFLAAFFAGC